MQWITLQQHHGLHHGRGLHHNPHHGQLVFEDEGSAEGV
jgi:hypothetical protein